MDRATDTASSVDVTDQTVMVALTQGCAATFRVTSHLQEATLMTIEVNLTDCTL
jgi:hypothetical protein